MTRDGKRAPLETMRIGLVTPFFLPEVGGAQVAVHEIARRLSGRGHHVTVIAPVPADLARSAPYRVSRVRPAHRLPLVSRRTSFAGQIAAVSVRERLQVISAHYVVPAGESALLARRFTRVPVVVTSHGGDVQSVADIGYGMPLEAGMEARLRDVLERADLSTAISREIGRRMVQLGAPEAKVRAVANGTDGALMRRENRDAARHRLALEPNDMAVLMVGRNHPVKNYQHLLQAVARTSHPCGSALRVFLVGHDTDALRPMVEQLDLQRIVTILGEVPKSAAITSLDGLVFPSPELAAVYRACDVFVLPSSVEGFPLVVPEAMAAGLPVICTDVGGNRDIVVDGVNGFLFPPADVDALAERIEALRNDRDLLRALSQRASAMADHYSWDAVIDAYEAAFGEVVA